MLHVSYHCHVTGPLTSPRELSVWSINASAIFLSWQCTDEVIGGHVIQYQQSDGVMWTRHVPMTPCTFLERNISSNMSYTCMVASYNGVGTGPFSNPVTVTTPPAGNIHLSH